MRIANITLNGYSNLGNKLQLYAMQQILQKYGMVEYIEWKNYKVKKIGIKNRIKLAIRSVQKKIFFVLNKMPIPAYFASIKRYKTFINFDKKHIKTCKTKFKSKRTENKLNKRFDFFVAGSDQIWNPNFMHDNMYVSMLGFCSSEKRVAIAPSVAVDDLTPKQESEFKKYLVDYKYLSCREEQGAALMSNLLNKEVTSLLDPTLMLDAEEWFKVANKPKHHDENKKYILVYFLGNITETYRYIINTISKRYNLEVINLLDKKSKYYACGPSEFVYLVKNCEIMLTDSFHGSVFSYIFNKPFKIFVRKDKTKSMNSRLLNLIEKLKLGDNIYFNGDENLFETNYDKKWLYLERHKFFKYVEKSLGVNNE